MSPLTRSNTLSCACMLLMTATNCSSEPPASNPSQGIETTPAPVVTSNVPLPQPPVGVVRGVGHGAFFDRDGRPFVPSLAQIEMTQDYLFTILSHPAAGLNSPPVDSDDVVQNALLLSNGLRASSLRHRATFVEVNAATLNYYLRRFASSEIRDEVGSLKQLVARNFGGGTVT